MKKMGCAQCGGAMKMKKMQTGGSSTPVQFDMTNRELRKFRKETKKSSKEAAKGAMKKMQKGGSTGIVGMPQYSNNPRSEQGRILQKGGAFAPNRNVQASCKGGMVRDENGVMERKMAKGGFPDLTGDNKVTQADILKGRGVFKKGGWIQGAIKKPGALREQLGVKQGEKIPKAKLTAAAKKGGKLGQRARLAITLSKMNKK